MIPSSSCVSWRFHYSWTLLPSMSCLVHLVPETLLLFWKASWRILSFSSRSTKEGNSGLASLEVYFRWKGEDLSSGGSLIFVKEPPRASFLIPESLNSGVSNNTELFGGCSWEAVSLELGGAVRRTDRMKGSEWDHLYFFSKNVNKEV